MSIDFESWHQSCRYRTAFQSSSLLSTMNSSLPVTLVFLGKTRSPCGWRVVIPEVFRDMLRELTASTSTQGLREEGPGAFAPGPLICQPDQSACFLRKAGISISSMPLLASASTLAVAWARPWRQTLGVLRWL